jgi:antitoxin component of RelBE/YafQ-DinJ toxin-antitoxin module
MNTTIIQVPVDKALRDRATAAASKMGFSSVQEVVRVFLTQISVDYPKVSFEQPAVKLSAKNERRYNKMIDDYKSGKMKTVSFDNVDEMMKYLNS